MLTEHEIQIRVRYQETDAQARVHHANYLTYFEQARVEFLRACGHSYKDLEATGIMLVVIEANLTYEQPAEYDDLLTVRVKTVAAKGARLTHEYEVLRGSDLICRGRTIVACVNRQGRAQRLPAWLAIDLPPKPSGE